MASLPRLEPVVAHGARMSWAGIMRPGDEFPLAAMSRLAVMTSVSDQPLKRCFGPWSRKYRRFTTNLTSPRIKVELLEPGHAPVEGIQCVVHWLDRRHILATGPGSVCAGDGWPEKLWNAFIAKLEGQPPGTVAEKLRYFATVRDEADEPDVVTEWRSRFKGGGAPRTGGASALGEGWVPIPADFVTPGGLRQCIISWAPNAATYTSLSEALATQAARQRIPDVASQATYYAECTLAKLHGVRFGPHDRIEDDRFAKRAEVQDAIRRLQGFEEAHIASPQFGRLDAYSPHHV
jgi:hypothetical protein